MEGKKLNDLDIYKLAVELSALAWQVFEKLQYPDKCHIGYQFLESVDSVGANIAEGFGRFHYKDSLKFYYYSRGSLHEAKHWIYLLRKRDLVDIELYTSVVTN